MVFTGFFFSTVRVAPSDYVHGPAGDEVLKEQQESADHMKEAYKARVKELLEPSPPPPPNRHNHGPKKITRVEKTARNRFSKWNHAVNAAISELAD